MAQENSRVKAGKADVTKEQMHSEMERGYHTELQMERFQLNLLTTCYHYHRVALSKNRSKH